MRLLFSIFLSLTTLFIANRAHARIHKFVPGKLHWNNEFSYFSTTANFLSQDGSFKAIGGGRNYNVLLIRERLDFNYSKNMNFFTQLEIGKSQSDDGSFVRNYSALTELKLGANYLFRRNKKLKVIPEIYYALPLFPIESNIDSTISHDGATHVGFGMHLQRPVWQSLNTLYLGYEHRDLGLSSLLRYKYNIAVNLFRRHWDFYLKGHTSISDDEFLLSPTTRTIITDRVNGGSLYVYSVNPSLHQFGLGTHFKLSKFSTIAFHLDSSYQGQNSAKGETFYITLKFRNLLNLYSEQGLKRRKKREQVEKFKAEYEDYDEALFEAEDSDSKSAEKNPLTEEDEDEVEE